MGELDFNRVFVIDRDTTVDSWMETFPEKMMIMKKKSGARRMTELVCQMDGTHLAKFR
jgi:hypothetical protein